jgi:hypothetical protein
MLDIYALLRAGSIVRDAAKAGHFIFSDAYSGAPRGRISFVSRLDARGGWLRLLYSVDGKPQDYTIPLTTTPQPFGGCRWWFVCPSTRGRVCKLYLPPGAARFASRRAYRLGYRCQRETPADRALSREFKLRRQLGCEHSEIRKPRWMRWATFDRELERLAWASGISDANFVAAAQRQTAARGRGHR